MSKTETVSRKSAPVLSGPDGSGVRALSSASARGGPGARWREGRCRARGTASHSCGGAVPPGAPCGCAWTGHISLLCLPSEEVLKTHIAHWWSPDGTRLAYATINDSRVPVMELPTYTGAVYPAVKSYHYPKVGATPPSPLRGRCHPLSPVRGHSTNRGGRITSRYIHSAPSPEFNFWARLPCFK